MQDLVAGCEDKPMFSGFRFSRHGGVHVEHGEDDASQNGTGGVHLFLYKL